LRCRICGNLTFKIFCKSCIALLAPSPRQIKKLDLNIISFYEYDEIEKLLKFKYDKFGDKVLHGLAKLSFLPFFQEFQSEEKLTVIPIDDFNKNFSHTAIFAKYCKTKTVKPQFQTLKARNQIKYAGKDLEFRLGNPKDFQLKRNLEHNVILVDDVITTGTTLLEAKETIEKKGVKVVLALTLAHAIQ